MNIIQAIISTLAFLTVSWLVSLMIVIGYFLGFETGLTYFVGISGFILLFLVWKFLSRSKGVEKPIFRNPKAVDVILSVLLGAALVIIQKPLTVLFNYFAGTDYSTEIVVFHQSLTSLNGLSDLIFIPVAHELFFRRYLQHRLQLRYGQVLGLFAASLVYALANLPLFSASTQLPEVHSFHAFSAFFVGLTTGYLYQRSGSVWTAIVIHMIWVGCALLIIN